MRARVSAVKPAPPLPCVPIAQSLRVRGSQAVQGGHVFRLPHRERGEQQQLAGRADPAQARVPVDLGTRAPEDRQRDLRLRARPGHGGDARALSPTRRERSPPQWRPRRQPPGEPGAVGNSTADRHPGRRRPLMGARNHRQIQRSNVYYTGELGAQPPKLISNNAQDCLTERSWRCRDSNPGPPRPFLFFSERSLLCFSQPRRSRRQDADGLSHCLIS